MANKLWLERLWGLLSEMERGSFSRNDIAEIIQANEKELNIPRSITISRVLRHLVGEGRLSEVKLLREGRRTTQGSMTRFVTDQASPLGLGLSLRANSYLSHSTAVFVQGLTEQVPKTIYVNKEQSPKPHGKGRLTQPAIDRAFSNAPRKSKYVFVTEENRFVLLSGKNTRRLGVEEVRETSGKLIDVTNVERTLIDIVVRSVYSGGIPEIMNVYRNAKGKVSIKRLLGILRELDYTYPYHQSIGFIMERAGFAEEELRLLESLGIKWKFYLDYKLVDPAFDERWKLFHPKGL